MVAHMYCWTPSVVLKDEEEIENEKRADEICYHLIVCCLTPCTPVLLLSHARPIRDNAQILGNCMAFLCRLV